MEISKKFESFMQDGSTGLGNLPPSLGRKMFYMKGINENMNDSGDRENEENLNT